MPKTNINKIKFILKKIKLRNKKTIIKKETNLKV